MVHYAEILAYALVVILILLRTYDDFQILKDSIKTGIARNYIFGIFQSRGGIPSLLEYHRKEAPISYWGFIGFKTLGMLIKLGLLVFILLFAYANNFGR